MIRAKKVMKRLLFLFFAILIGLQTGVAAQGRASRLQAFGIFSPVMGIQEAIPSVTIPEVFTHDNENVVLKYGEIHRAKMRSDQCVDDNNDGVVLPDGNPVLRYHYFEKADGTDYLLAFTKDNIYHWDTANDEWDRKFVCSSSCDDWSVVTYNDKCYATNNVDFILEWDGEDPVFHNAAEADKYNTGTVTTDGDTTIVGSGTSWTGNVAAGDRMYIEGEDRQFTIVEVTDNTSITLSPACSTSGSDLTYVIDDNVGITVGSSTYLTKAKLLASFEGYLLALNVTAGATAYPQGIYWCDTQDGDTWDSGNAGDLLLPGPDPISGTGQIADFLLIFSHRSIDQLWATESTLIFNNRRLRNNMGTFSPDSIVNGPSGELYFMDNRKNIRLIKSPMSDMRIVSRSIDPTVKLIQDGLVSGVRSTWIDTLEQIWWSIPYGTDATANNKVLCLDPYGAWTQRDLAVSAFGRFEEKTTYTIDTIPFDSIDEIGWETIDSVEAKADYRLDICGDTSGYTWNSHNSEEDAGSSYTGYAVIGTDFSQVKGTPLVDRYKRLVFLTVIFRNEGAGTAMIELKRDFESAWNTVGSVSLDSNTGIIWEKLNADYRARYFQVKVSATNTFRFIGCIFYYTVEGVR